MGTFPLYAVYVSYHMGEITQSTPHGYNSIILCPSCGVDRVRHRVRYIHVSVMCQILLRTLTSRNETSRHVLHPWDTHYVKQKMSS